MPSPFPGMDPYIETQEWGDFHQSFIQCVRDLLNDVLPGGYAARVERRVYYQDEVLIEDPQFMVPDGVVLEDPIPAGRRSAAPQAAVAEIAAPVEIYLPEVTEHREAWLEIREVRTRRIVTLLELLSPANKTTRHRGRRLYLRKRRTAFRSRTHFVEIDLLRGGRSLLTVSRQPDFDYYALVSRAEQRPKAELFPWRLRDPLPTIGIPLMKGDADVPIKLGDVLTRIYDRSRYAAFLDYGALCPRTMPCGPGRSSTHVGTAVDAVMELESPTPANRDPGRFFRFRWIVAAAVLYLELDGSTVRDEHLARIASLRDLDRLGLDGTQITNAGLAHLRSLGSLTTLSLDGTAVTDDGLIHLAALHRLETLSLSSTRMIGTGLFV